MALAFKLMNFSVCYGVWIQVANASHDESIERRDPWPSRSKNARFRASERALYPEPWIAFFFYM